MPHALSKLNRSYALLCARARELDVVPWALLHAMACLKRSTRTLRAACAEGLI